MLAIVEGGDALLETLGVGRRGHVGMEEKVGKGVDDQALGGEGEKEGNREGERKREEGKKNKVEMMRRG